MTFAGNVPRNDDLAAVTDPAGFAAARAAFEDGWNELNLVRAVSATVAFALAVGALMVATSSRRRSQPVQRVWNTSTSGTPSAVASPPVSNAMPARLVRTSKAPISQPS